MSYSKAIAVGAIWIGVGLSAFGAGEAAAAIAFFAMLVSISVLVAR